MNQCRLAALAEIEQLMTPSWSAHSMVHEDTGEPMTPDQMGRYVANSIEKTIEGDGGGNQFLFISGDTPDRGARDVALIGNGPAGPYNAQIAKVRNALLELVAVARAAKNRRQAFAEIDKQRTGLALYQALDALDAKLAALGVGDE